MAAKTSASAAFNSYFYQQQQQQQHNQTKQQQMESLQQNGEQQLSDLHLKMSKKIAQLTKVIYALNSKNDESENLISNLKAHYEEEKDQVVFEANRRLDEFKEKFALTNDQTKKIATLETALDQFQLQKEKALKEFEEFRLKSVENEEQLINAHQDELVELNKKLGELKNEYDLNLSEFASLDARRDEAKAREINELKTKHRLEIEKLKEQYTSSSKDSFKQERAKLVETYESELERIRRELEESVSKASQEKLEYELNVNKLKAFHERELEACKQNSSSEFNKLITTLKADVELLQRQKQSVEVEFAGKLKRKLEELVDKEEEIKGLNEMLNKFRSNFDTSNNDLNLLNQKIAKLEVENKTLESRVVDMGYENQSCLKKLDFQSRTILEKSNEISKLEASNMQYTSTISDLRHELKVIKDRLDLIVKERQDLENENARLSGKTSEIVKSLKEKCEALEKAKLDIQLECQQKLDSFEQSHAKSLEKLNTEFEIEKQAIISSYESKLSTEKASFEEKLLIMERDLSKNYNSEVGKLLSERNEFKSQLDALGDEHKTRMRQNEQEIKALNEKLSKALKDLADINTAYKGLNEAKSKLEVDFDLVSQKSERQRVEINDLTSQLEQLRNLFESSSNESKLDLKVKLDMLNRDLDAKWAEILRVECEKIRVEIGKAKEEEKRVELESLRGLKDEEIRNLKAVWQSKTNELLDEISSLKNELNEKEAKSRAIFESTKNKLELENQELRDHLSHINAEHKARLDKIQSEQNQEQRVLFENLIKENEIKIAELKNRHLEDLKAQTIAQKAALASLKASLENSKAIEIEMLNEANTKKLEMFKFETEQKYYNELDALKHDNELEILSIRVELDNAIEMSKQKERESEMKLEELHSEIRHKQKQVDKVGSELKELRLLNSTLKEEIDLKQRELKQIRSDALNEIRNKEAIMQQKRDEEIARLNSENHKQKQMLINEFRQAQELLKQKIIETENELRQLHDRFLNRESRSEDVELIQILRNNLAERDDLIKKIQDEKKFFQMELVNRENNFNKMFNASPNIGTINPLNANTKIKSKSNGNTGKPAYNASTIGVAARLDPIPGVGSPMHDLNLNPNKPLPKKFLS